MDIDPHTKDRRCSESYYSPEASAIWFDDTANSNLSGSSEPSQSLLDNCDIFSNFGDQDCGEPSRPQHLVFDFTPDPKIDTMEEQEKCIAFWDFVKSQPILKNLCVKSKPPVAGVAKASPTTKPEVVHDAPALEVLDRSRNFMKIGFGGKKYFQGDCSQDNDSYSEIDSTMRAKSVPEPAKSFPISMCTCSGTCSKCRKNKRKTKKPDQERVKKLNNILDEWDEHHPKSMEPPGPLMQLKPILQRRLPPDQKPKTCVD